MGRTVAVKLIAWEASLAGAGEAMQLTSSAPP
jgi:hypothetical protein